MADGSKTTPGTNSKVEIDYLRMSYININLKINNIRIIYFLCIVLSLSGCFTNYLHNKTDVSNRTEKYTAKVSSVLISSDNKNLVFVESKFHYIFELPEVLSQIFRSELRSAIDVEFSTFKINSSHEITGILDLSLSDSLNRNLIEEAERLGFENGKYGRLVQTLKLNGIRYLVGTVNIPEEPFQLLKEYRILIEFSEVSSTRKSMGKAAEILLTPIAIAADGVIAIGAIPLLVVGEIMHEPRTGGWR